jgi:hypothetical protein
MKKLFTTLTIFAGLMLTACGSGTNSGGDGGTTPGTNTDSYQFWGKLEEGGSYASFTDAAYLLNLDVDGKTSLDKYAFATYDASPAATNRSYTKSYMAGTWKAVKKEGVDALQIKLAYINDDGTEEGSTTYYAYESEGEYSVDLNIALVKGQQFTRKVEMEGQKGKKYANADAFIQAYKKDFVEPTNVLKVESKENGGVAYFQEDGKVLIYSGTNKIAEGTYVKAETSLTLTIGETKIPVTLSTAGCSFTYTYDLAGYSQVELVFEFSTADFAKLPTNAGQGQQDETVLLAMTDAEHGATLTFKKDKTYVINMDFGSHGAFDVQTGTWSFANYTVTLTPASGEAYNSRVAEEQFIVSTHITWGGGSVDTDVTFAASQTVIGLFMQA